MGCHRPLFTFKVEHDYFSGVCPCLEFEPSAYSQRIISNCGLLIRKSEGGFTVIYDKERCDALTAYAQDQAEPLCLEFKAYSIDPQFKSYSEPFSEITRDSILYFDNRKNSVAKGRDVRLHTTDYVTNIDCENLDSVQIRDLLSQKDRLIPPLFVVKIYLFADEGSPLQTQSLVFADKHYYLRFKSRQTIWKYYLLGDVANKNTYIFDPDIGIEFEFSGEEALANGQPAKVFRSRQELSLRHRQSFRFQLKERTVNGDRVLIKRLPVASIERIGKEVVSEQEIVVSEIYVNS